MTTSDQVAAVERWFIARGVPHFIDRYEAATDIWTRALPILLLAYLAGGLRALDIYDWTLAENLAAAGVVIAVLVAGWIVANIVFRRPWLSIPREIGPPELIAFVVGPSIPPLVFTQYRDAIAAFLTGIAVLVAIYFGTSYGVVPMLRWAARRAVTQILLLTNLIVRALPLLLLFTTFLFINGEVWAVAGTLDGLAYWLTLAIFFLLGVLFVLSRVPPLMQDLASFPSWAEVHEMLNGTPAAMLDCPREGNPEPQPLKFRQKLNVWLLMLFSQALQITLVVVLLFGFFILFGFLAISEANSVAFSGVEDINVVARLTLDGRELVVTEPLIRVAGFLGAFSGMYFTVVLATDATYRDEFAEDVRPEVHRLFAVRLAYRWAIRNR